APDGRRGAAAQHATPRRDRRSGGPAAKRTPGQKRPAAELAKVADALIEHIKANPGSRMEAMVKALGMARNDLVYPIKGLIAAKKIRSKGQKRSTQYFPLGNEVSRRISPDRPPPSST